MSLWSDLLGTTKAFFRIGKTGPRLKDDSGNLTVRNAGDSAPAEVTLKQLHNTDDQIELNSDAAGAGADWKLTIAKNPAASAHLTVQMPPAKGTDGHLLRQKAGTAAGVLEFELTAPTSTDINMSVDTTALAFGDASPKSMFTLPLNGVIDKVQIIIDTAFDGTPTASVGVNGGSASKYVATSDLDLTAPAETVFEIHPGKPAPGAPEALEIAYAAGGATAGAARFLVYYTPVPG